MKKLHNTIIRLNDEIYYADIRVIIGEYAYYQKYCVSLGLEEIKQENYGGEMQQLTNTETGDYAFLVWFPHIDFTSINYGVITHEFIHLVFRVFQTVGIKLDFENQEPLAYYMEYLITQFLQKAVKRYKKK